MTAMAAWGVYSIAGSPTNVTAGASTANSALPNASDGNRARYIRLLSTGNAWVRLGTSNAVTVDATNGILIGSSNDVVLYCRGSTHIAYLRTGGADVTVSIAPVEV